MNPALDALLRLLAEQLVDEAHAEAAAVAEPAEVAQNPAACAP